MIPHPHLDLEHRVALAEVRGHDERGGRVAGDSAPPAGDERRSLVRETPGQRSETSEVSRGGTSPDRGRASSDEPREARDSAKNPGDANSTADSTRASGPAARQDVAARSAPGERDERTAEPAPPAGSGPESHRQRSDRGSLDVPGDDRLGAAEVVSRSGRSSSRMAGVVDKTQGLTVPRGRHGDSAEGGTSGDHAHPPGFAVVGAQSPGRAAATDRSVPAPKDGFHGCARCSTPHDSRPPVPRADSGADAASLRRADGDRGAARAGAIARARTPRAIDNQRDEPGLATFADDGSGRHQTTRAEKEAIRAPADVPRVRPHTAPDASHPRPNSVGRPSGEREPRLPPRARAEARAPVLVETDRRDAMRGRVHDAREMPERSVDEAPRTTVQGGTVLVRWGPGAQDSSEAHDLPGREPKHFDRPDLDLAKIPRHRVEQTAGDRMRPRRDREQLTAEPAGAQDLMAPRPRGRPERNTGGDSSGHRQGRPGGGALPAPAAPADQPNGEDRPSLRRPERFAAPPAGSHSSPAVASRGRFQGPPELRRATPEVAAMARAREHRAEPTGPALGRGRPPVGPVLQSRATTRAASLGRASQDRSDHGTVGHSGAHEAKASEASGGLDRRTRELILAYRETIVESAVELGVPPSVVASQVAEEYSRSLTTKHSIGPFRVSGRIKDIAQDALAWINVNQPPPTFVPLQWDLGKGNANLGKALEIARSDSAAGRYLRAKLGVVDAQSVTSRGLVDFLVSDEGSFIYSAVYAHYSLGPANVVAHETAGLKVDPMTFTASLTEAYNTGASLTVEPGREADDPPHATWFSRALSKARPGSAYTPALGTAGEFYLDHRDEIIEILDPSGSWARDPNVGEPPSASPALEPENAAEHRADRDSASRGSPTSTVGALTSDPSTLDSLTSSLDAIVASAVAGGATNAGYSAMVDPSGNLVVRAWVDYPTGPPSVRLGPPAIDGPNVHEFRGRDDQAIPEAREPESSAEARASAEHRDPGDADRSEGDDAVSGRESAAEADGRAGPEGASGPL